MPRARRWIILARDGRQVTLGRDTAPTEEEVVHAASALATAGHIGWLVRLDGKYWTRRSRPVLTLLRSLAGATDADWLAAMEAFETMRRASFTPARCTRAAASTA